MRNLCVNGSAATGHSICIAYTCCVTTGPLAQGPHERKRDARHFWKFMERKDSSGIFTISGLNFNSQVISRSRSEVTSLDETEREDCRH